MAQVEARLAAVIAQAQSALRHQSADGVLTRRSRRFPAALCARTSTCQQVHRRSRGYPANWHHRRQHRPEVVQPAGHRRVGAGQRTADHLSLLEPDLSECIAKEAYGWSQSRAVFASGSPLPSVEYNGKTLVTGRANNVHIFPAIGTAVLARGDVHRRRPRRRRSRDRSQFSRSD